MKHQNCNNTIGSTKIATTRYDAPEVQHNSMNHQIGFNSKNPNQIKPGSDKTRIWQNPDDRKPQI